MILNRKTMRLILYTCDQMESFRILINDDFLFIEKDGSVTFSKILKSSHEILSKEVERVIKLSPKWEPAIQKGEKVRVKFAIPVAFAIHNN